MSQWHGDQFLNGLLKALQIISEQLIRDCLGDLLAFVDIRPVVPVTNRVVLLAREFVGREFTTFKKPNELLSQLRSAAGVCVRSSGGIATTPVYFFAGSKIQPHPPPTSQRLRKFFQL